MPKSAQHILILFHDFSFGGTEVIALRLAAEWVRLGRRVTILCGTPDGPLWSAVPAGVHVERLSPEIGRSLFSRLRLRRALPSAIRRLHPDILFLPGNFHLVLAGAARGLRSAPKVVAKISNPLAPISLAPLRWLVERAYRWAARDADWFAAMSSGLADDVRRLTASDRVSTVFDPNLSGQARRRRSRVVDPSMPLHIVAAGRLAPQKDFGLAIRIAARLASIREVRLTIWGEGPERAALEKLARDLRIADRVALPGYTASITAALEDADLLLISSRYEGGPAVAVEALEAGVPVAATDCSHFLHDVIADEDRGLIIASRRPEVFAERLNAWIERSDPNCFSPRGATEAFGTAHSALCYLRLFDDLVTAGGETARSQASASGQTGSMLSLS